MVSDLQPGHELDALALWAERFKADIVDGVARAICFATLTAVGAIGDE